MSYINILKVLTFFLKLTKIPFGLYNIQLEVILSNR